MKNKFKWYRILRFLTPLAYTTLVIKGFIDKPIILLVVLGVSTLLGGAWFCGWLCPLGFTQELFGKLARLLHIPRIRFPQKVATCLSITRYVLLGLSFLGIGAVLVAQSPYASFMGIVDWNMSYITETAWIILGIFIGLSLFIDRPFCHYFCPVGAKYGILSLMRIFTITRDEKKCISCKKCDAVCPAQIEISKHLDVRNAQCINCMECIAKCPVKGTLKFEWAFKQNKH